MMCENQLTNNRQLAVRRFLKNSYLKKRLVHAYIFEGEKGAGKLSLAKDFAKMIICQSGEGTCGRCHDCKAIEDGNHVNVIRISPEGKTIRKEQIQRLQHEFSKTAAVTAAKIYIIEAADSMSISASNSLLKFLEEPAEDTYALLLTENSETLLPTIRSRSVTLKLKSLSQEELQLKYKDAGIGKYSALMAALTQNIDEAKTWSASKELHSLAELVVKIENALMSTRQDPSIVIAQNQALFKEVGNSQLFLRLYQIFYRDVLLGSLESGRVPAFSFQHEALLASIQKNQIGDCVRKLKAIMEAQRRLAANANMMLTFDWLFLEIK